VRLRTCQWTAEHPQHGTFYVTQLLDGGRYDCSRVYGKHPDFHCYRFALGSDSLYAAAEAITRHVHQLDKAALLVEPPVTLTIPETP
jgi:hypothetical protein